MQNNKTVKKFELDPKAVKVKDMLNKDFLELQIKAISTANPNRNGSYFTRESLENAVPSFYNKPILGSFSLSQDDFRGHEGDLSYDEDYEQLYYDYTDEASETPLGLIRGDDKVEIIHDTKDGLDWLTFTCAIWVKYNYKQVKKLLKSKDGHKKISVEVEVNRSEFDENGTEIIQDFTFDGVTILGDKYETGIADANMTILDMVDNALFQKQQKCLAFAYDKLDKTNVETPDEVVPTAERDSNKEFTTEDTSVDNEKEKEISMEEKGNQKGGKDAMPEKEEQALELEQKAEEPEKETEACGSKEEEAKACEEAKETCAEQDEPSEDEKDEPSESKKEEEACDAKFEEAEEPEKDEEPKKEEEAKACEEAGCGEKEEESCNKFEDDENDEEDKDDSDDSEDKDDKEDDPEDSPKKEEESLESHSEFEEVININEEPEPLPLDGKSMAQIVADATQSIQAPPVEANDTAKQVANDEPTTKAEVDPLQPEDKANERDEMFEVSNAEPEMDKFEELQKKYAELEEKYNKLNDMFKNQEAVKLAQFGADFINADEVVDEESKKEFASQVEEKCKAFELNTEEEVTKFAKGLMAMYYYEHMAGNKETKNEEFSVNINKPAYIENHASNNKLKDAIHKLNYLE